MVLVFISLPAFLSFLFFFLIWFTVFGWHVFCLIQPFGVQVHDCVFDGVLLFWSAPSKTQSHTCNPNCRRWVNHLPFTMIIRHFFFHSKFQSLLLVAAAMLEQYCWLFKGFHTRLFYPSEWRKLTKSPSLSKLKSNKILLHCKNTVTPKYLRTHIEIVA